MNKNIFLLIFVCFVLHIPAIYAQEGDLTTRIIKSDKVQDSMQAVGLEEKTAFKNNRPMNAVKLNLSSFVTGNLSLQYERAINTHISAALGFRVMIGNSMPFKNAVSDYLANNDEMDEQANNTIRTFVDNVNMRGWAITPEVRFYTSKGNRGFYVAPFLRIEQHNLKSSLLLAIDSKDYVLQFDAKYRNVGGGLLLGWNFNIGKHFGIDWWILGPYIGSMQTNIYAYNYYIDPADMQEYEEQINDLKFENDWVKGTVKASNTDANIDIKGTVPAIRAMGINFVYRF